MTESSRPPITVMMSEPAPNGTTQYIDLMNGLDCPGVTYRYFSWRTALRTDFDVLHLHWPELRIRDSRSPALAFAKRRMMGALLRRLERRRIPIVRTFHNPRPHERGEPAEERMLDRIDERTDLFLALNEHTRPAGGESVVIPHPHYADAFRKYPHPQPVAGRLVYFGIIRPYKNVEALISAFRGMERADASLSVVGSPHRGQQRELLDAAGDDPRIRQILRFVDDAELVREVCQASLVVLPYLEMRNSGALLVAMSLGRPALVPDSAVNRLLAEEFGPDWVRVYEGPLTPGILESHLAAIETTGLHSASRPGPDLSARAAERLGQLHRDAYDSVLRGVGAEPALVADTR